MREPYQDHMNWLAGENEPEPPNVREQFFTEEEWADYVHNRVYNHADPPTKLGQGRECSYCRHVVRIICEAFGPNTRLDAFKAYIEAQNEPITPEVEAREIEGRLAARAYEPMFHDRKAS